MVLFTPPQLRTDVKKKTMQGIVYQRWWKHFIQHHDGVLDGNLLQLPVNVEAARARIGVEFCIRHKWCVKISPCLSRTVACTIA